jgi:hypothetical protein
MGGLVQKSFNGLPAWNHAEELTGTAAESQQLLDSLLTDNPLTETQLQQLIIFRCRF